MLPDIKLHPSLPSEAKTETIQFTHSLAGIHKLIFIIEGYQGIFAATGGLWRDCGLALRIVGRDRGRGRREG
jgi:hypothetical protein